MHCWRWKCIRRNTRCLRPADYDQRVELITDLQTLEGKGLINLFYGDESGLSLMPMVP